MQTEKILLTTSLTATSALVRLRLVNFAGATCGAGARARGVANAGYDIGEQAGVNTRGDLLVEAGAAITAGAEVESDASGRVITRTSGVLVGVAVDAAAAAGDFIRIDR